MWFCYGYFIDRFSGLLYYYYPSTAEPSQEANNLQLQYIEPIS